MLRYVLFKIHLISFRSPFNILHSVLVHNLNINVFGILSVALFYFVLQVLQITSDTFQEKLMTAARKLYIHKYSTEVELNLNFKTFVHNYQAAFDGKNTRRHQLFYARNKKSVSKTESK